MKQEKTFIQNRNGQKIAVLVDYVENPKGLAFVMHGLSGTKESLQVQAFAQAFWDNAISTVRFDTRHTFGESEGRYEDATITSYYEDLEDVIVWAGTQQWYQEPFFLCGHSLGGISVALFAQKFPRKVKAVAPISTVVAGVLQQENNPEVWQEWKNAGWREEQSTSRPGMIKRLPYSHAQSRLQYDLRMQAKIMTMPVLLLVGSNDTSTPVAHQQLLFAALPEGNKELTIVEGADHDFRVNNKIPEMQEVLTKWIRKHI